MAERRDRGKTAKAKPRVKKVKKGKSAGRPEFDVTAADREKVEILIGGGMAVEEVAAAMDVAVNTLKKHFGLQLKTGRSKKRSEILLAMFNSAKGGNVSAQKAFIQLNALADADDAAQTDMPAPKAAKVYKGKKEIAQEEAMNVGGAGSVWGTDLDPTAPPLGIKAN